MHQTSLVQREVWMLAPGIILKSTKTGKFYPLSFIETPKPKKSQGGQHHRFQSSKLHTEGFDTKEGAVAYLCREHKVESYLVLDWDEDTDVERTEWLDLSPANSK